MDIWKSTFELVFGRRGARTRPRSETLGHTQVGGGAAATTPPSPQPVVDAPVATAPVDAPVIETPVIETPVIETPAIEAPTTPMEAEATAPPEPVTTPISNEAPTPLPDTPPEPVVVDAPPQPQADANAPTGPTIDNSDTVDDDGPSREPTPEAEHDATSAIEDQPTSSTETVVVETPTPKLVWTDGWNPAVDEARRLRSPNRRARGATKVSRVVVHITGTADFAAARNSFMNPASQASAHYCIDRNGDLYQFVSEDDVAWHAGIHNTVDPVYAPRNGDWRKYKRYFSWHRGYPADAVFLNAQGQPCPREQAKLVARADGSAWPDYAYFNARWGEKPEPVGYEISKAINQGSIGIETVGHGGASPAAYTDAMYKTLATLVADICERHGIANTFGPVCGHEDVNPVERWGWDPGAGFDWSRVVKS